MSGSGSREASATAGREAEAFALDQLHSQLRTLPAFRALLRSVEAGLVHAAGPFEPALLDLGCGDGDFGERVLPAHAIGLDPDPRALRWSRRGSPRRRALAGSATALPLADGSVATVVANSVLEHIADLDAALAECARVLRPGGRLVVTSPSHRFRDHLATSRMLSAVGLHGPARRYGAWFDRHSAHFHTLSVEEWERLLACHRLAIREHRYYFSRRAHALFEILHYLGTPTLLFRRLTGRWVPWRNPVTYGLALSGLAPVASTAAVADGTYLFFVAERRP